MASPGHTDLSFKAFLDNLVRSYLKTKDKNKWKKIVPAFQMFRVISSGLVSSVSALEDHALQEKTYEQLNQKGWVSAHGRVISQDAEPLGFNPSVSWPPPQNSQ